MLWSVHRLGIRAVDLKDKKIFKEKFDNAFDFNKRILVKVFGLSPSKLNKKKIFNEYSRYARRLEKYIGDSSLEINQALDKGKKVLFEGAQGIFLGVDYGVYPHGTSSNTISGAVCTGAGGWPQKD